MNRFYLKKILNQIIIVGGTQQQSKTTFFELDMFQYNISYEMLSWKPSTRDLADSHYINHEAIRFSMMR